VSELQTIQIKVNGEDYQLAAAARVTDLISKLALTPERLAIELNLNILPRAKWNETILQAGDKLEIVHFVGGG
jgi:thiamine biosynthesis protein ThiS